MKDRVYIFGLVLVILSFISCVISYYLIIFVAPVFVVGAVIIFFSKKKISTKIIAAITPLILYLPSTYLFLLAYNYTSAKTFLIPAEYEGPIRIVYEEKCGAKPYKENGSQILQFPESGILVLNEKFDGGINNDYYFVDKKGLRTRIERIIDYKDRSKVLPSIMVLGSGGLGDDSDDDDITFTEFYIYKKDTTQTYDGKTLLKFDSMTTAIVKACRMK